MNTRTKFYTKLICSVIFIWSTAIAVFGEVAISLVYIALIAKGLEIIAMQIRSKTLYVLTGLGVIGMYYLAWLEHGSTLFLAIGFCCIQLPFAIWMMRDDMLEYGQYLVKNKTTV